MHLEAKVKKFATWQILKRGERNGSDTGRNRSKTRSFTAARRFGARDPKTSAKTRLRIEEAARSMGYQPNSVARALVTGRTYQVALYLPMLDSSFTTELIRQFELLARSPPYNLLVRTFGTAYDSQTPMLVDGALIYATPLGIMPPPGAYPSVLMRALSSHDLELSPDQTSVQDTIEFDMRLASHQAMLHLVSQGLKRIAIIAPDALLKAGRPRFDAYKLALQQAGLPSTEIPIRIALERRARHQIDEQLSAYFATHEIPDALFCSNDDIAIGAYRALKRLGRKIPEATAIIGCDDIEGNQDLSPVLTSIHLHTEKACQLAWDYLMQRLEQPHAEAARFTTINAELVIRESSVVRGSSSLIGT